MQRLGTFRRNMKILSIFDNEGASFDRYVVVFDTHIISPITGKTFYDYLGMSINPGNPQGFSQWGSSSFSPREDNDHLGKEINFDDLPDNVQKHLKMRIGE
jgi:hypothetical protein